jgi:AcrR family transcriptional regulator
MGTSSSYKRVYAGESADVRRARRREDLLDHALTMLARNGREGLSVSGLCAAAGLNARYFYESFANTDEVVEALVALLADESIGCAIAQLPDAAPSREDARNGVAAFVDFLTDDPRRGRVLFGAVPAGSAAAKHRDRTLHRFIAVASAHGRDIYGLEEDPRIDIAAAMVLGGTGQALLDWFDGRIAIDRSEFIDELAETWLALADSMTDRIRSD